MQPGPPAAGFACSLVNRPLPEREKESTRSERERQEAGSIVVSEQNFYDNRLKDSKLTGARRADPEMAFRCFIV
ncbi:hypothetical protein DBV15_01659 [Temnothorax longispinosus]|uniref:Uncharacterized protein n=1 Tax=Temnothorax longispinosus TaxID=300112 RepID=A0A4S2L169_9HYME|nr:hypothetical protein DBV15_01659 [Temnothorax longispinosus]